MEKIVTTQGKAGEKGEVIHTHPFTYCTLHRSDVSFSTQYTLEGLGMDQQVKPTLRFSTYPQP